MTVEAGYSQAIGPSCQSVKCQNTQGNSNHWLLVAEISHRLSLF